MSCARANSRKYLLNSFPGPKAQGEASTSPEAASSSYLLFTEGSWKSCRPGTHEGRSEPYTLIAPLTGLTSSSTGSKISPACASTLSQPVISSGYRVCAVSYPGRYLPGANDVNGRSSYAPRNSADPTPARLNASPHLCPHNCPARGTVVGTEVSGLSVKPLLIKSPIVAERPPILAMRSKVACPNGSTRVSICSSADQPG